MFLSYSLRHGRPGRDNVRFLALILAAYTGLHLVIEVQSRYMCFLFAIVAAFAVSGQWHWRKRLRERVRSMGPRENGKPRAPAE